MKTDKFLFQIYFMDHSYITSAKGLDGWGQRMAILADVHYYIYADIVGGWIRNSPKMCRNNIGKVPLYQVHFVENIDSFG